MVQLRLVLLEPRPSTTHQIKPHSVAQGLQSAPAYHHHHPKTAQPGWRKARYHPQVI